MKAKKSFGKAVMKCLTANSACIWVAYQPEFPEAANKLKFNK